MPFLNRLCHHLYVISLLLAATVLLFAPLHVAKTVRAPILETLPGDEIRFRAPGVRVPRAGEEISCFRFHGGWPHPLGKLRITGQDADGMVRARAVAGTFRWPLGAQGQVVSPANEEAKVRVNLGSRLALSNGATVYFFQELRLVGQGTVVSTASADAEVWIPSSPRHPPLAGALASVYSVPNTVAYCDSTALLAAERAAFGAVLVLLAWRGLHRRSWASTVEWARRVGAQVSRPRRFWGVLIGFPLLYYAVRFVLRSWDVVVRGLSGLVGLPKVFAPLASAERMLLVPALGLVAVLYLAVLLVQRRSPWQVLRERIAFRPPRFDGPVARRLERLGLTRDLAVWGLHVVVVYLFSRTLSGFLRANTAKMAALAWPGVEANFTSLPDMLSTLGAMLSHRPTFYTVEILVQVLNLLLFNVTLTGALFGYLYGVVSILWKKESVRNVDFTVTGWLVNAVSYGPLLGGAVWGMLPTISGEVPGVADGLVHHASLWVGLLLNLLYTSSIWNMGTMFGVMVDKGVRRSLMFSVVRHPCYTLEGVMFAVLALHQVSDIRAFVPLAANIFLYWLRSERDDDFMGASNPGYVEYRNVVRHKFLPGLV